MSDTKGLTTEDYWDSTYEKRKDVRAIDPDSSKFRQLRPVFEIKKRCGLKNKRIMEIGGGSSAWLVYLSEKFPSSDFTCLDYSKIGVEVLRGHAAAHNLDNLKVVEGDMFGECEDVGSQDFVYSHGVVEHFPDLPGVLKAHAKFLSDEGQLLVVIPNMAGVLGVLTKLMDRAVYDIHVPHDETSLVKGHHAASLEVVESGYLCSTNFGVLSSCVKRRFSLNWFIYAGLLTISRALWAFEERVFKLPVSRFFSPYIYVVSKRTGDTEGTSSSDSDAGVH